MPSRARRIRRRPPRRPSPRDEVLALHRALFRRQQWLIARSVQGYSPQFRAYEERYRRGVSRPFHVIPYEDVVQKIIASDLCYVGDYHTLKQAQRAFLKVLSAAVHSDRDVVAAVEFVQGKFQEELDRWLAGGIDDATFLRRIEYERHQVFDVWPHFKPIFDLCREQGVPMVAIDRLAIGPGALPARDAYAADRIARAVIDYPGALVLILVGQLHVAPAHLPAAVDRALGRGARQPRRTLVVHQNAEEIYFALEEAGKEHTVQAVRLSPAQARGSRRRTGAEIEELCLVNTSPVVAQQSYLDWVEGDGDVLEGPAPEQNFKQMARLIARFMGLEQRALKEALEEVQVYTAGDLSFLERLHRRGDFTPREIELLETQILARESYFIPRARTAYLATLSVNHAAEEAAHFVRSVVSGEEDDARGLIDGFYARTLEEGFAFFGSKLVNPRRKCPHEPELRRLLARAELDAVTRTIAEVTLAHKARERGQAAASVHKAIGGTAEIWNGVTHTLGYMLGEQLYYAMLRGTISKAEVREHFCDPLDEDGAAMSLYFYLVGKVGRTRIPKRA